MCQVLELRSLRQRLDAGGATEAERLLQEFTVPWMSGKWGGNDGENGGEMGEKWVIYGYKMVYKAHEYYSYRYHKP